MSEPASVIFSSFPFRPRRLGVLGLLRARPGDFEGALASEFRGDFRVPFADALACDLRGDLRGGFDDDEDDEDGALVAFRPFGLRFLVGFFFSSICSSSSSSSSSISLSSSSPTSFTSSTSSFSSSISSASSSTCAWLEDEDNTVLLAPRLGRFLRGGTFSFWAFFPPGTYATSSSPSSSSLAG
eukprot:CAMPEP_0170185982 /NCGR_PEP_ID=MMETSP0040_2-20121228/38007_1 /TAXON_ID=641309 /ORGANISM="Lotharella oceanica, Strain CCMP622" /LENGTH=183 /DNA_ID=CAMNT_0010432559 /DNA_START=215 /DNA_END=763 /DNA_ORIENTATION=+